MLMKTIPAGRALATFALTWAAGATAAYGAHQTGQGNKAPLFLTETNGSPNYLAVVNSATQETDYVATGGNGGAATGGNAGGVGVSGRTCGRHQLRLADRHHLRAPGRRDASHSNRQDDRRACVGRLWPRSSGGARNHRGRIVPGIRNHRWDERWSGSTPNWRRQFRADHYLHRWSHLLGKERKHRAVELINGRGPRHIRTERTRLAAGRSQQQYSLLGMIADGPYVYVTIAHSDLQALVVNGQIITTAVGPTPFTNSQVRASPTRPAGMCARRTLSFSSDSPGNNSSCDIWSATTTHIPRQERRGHAGRLAHRLGDSEQPARRHRPGQRAKFRRNAFRYEFRGRTDDAFRAQNHGPNQRSRYY